MFDRGGKRKRVIEDLAVYYAEYWSAGALCFKHRQSGYEAIGSYWRRSAMSKLQQRPSIVIHRRENHAVAQELVSCFPYVRDVHAH